MDSQIAGCSIETFFFRRLLLSVVVCCCLRFFAVVSGRERSRDVRGSRVRLKVSLANRFSLKSISVLSLSLYKAAFSLAI